MKTAKQFSSGLSEGVRRKSKKKKGKTTMNYAILNFKPYKTIASIKAVQIETTRQKEYANVDKEKTCENKIYEGDLNYERMIRESLKSDYYTQPDKYGRKHKEPDVKAVGCIMTYSPEAHLEQNKETLDQWAKDSISYIKSVFPGCPMTFVLHNDETTPHLQGIIIPTTDSGKISKNAFISGKQQLVKIQDDYALEMAKYGLKRGKRGLEERQNKETITSYRELKNKNEFLRQQNQQMTEANKELKLNKQKLHDLKLQKRQLEIEIKELEDRVFDLEGVDMRPIFNLNKNNEEIYDL